MKQPHERQDEHDPRGRQRPPPAPEPPFVQAGLLEWASAVGNQAVQRLARQRAEEEAPAPEAEHAPAEETETEVEAEQPDDALAPGDAEALAAVDDDAETLPE